MERHPLDFDALKKGDLVSPEQITHAFGHKRGTNEFRFDVMRLRQQIEEERQDLVTKGEGDAIRVLTDEEAAPYQDGRFHAERRGMARAYERQMRVDADGLQSATANEHARALSRNGLILQAMEGTMKKLRTTERETLPRLMD